MKNEYLCGYDNCSNEGLLPLIITDKTTEPSSRTYFCCYPHAIGFLLSKVERRGSASESAMLAIQGIVRITCEDFSGKAIDREYKGEPAA